MDRCPSLLAILSFTGLVVFCVLPEEKCHLGLWLSVSLRIFFGPRTNRQQDFQTYFRLLLLLSLALPPLGQGLLLIPLQALFGGLYYLLDVYVIEVWPTEVT